MNKDNFIEIRKIKKDDNEKIASIIRRTLEEYNSAIPGTAYFDKSLEDMFHFYQKEGTVYFVAIMGEEIVGGAGIGKLMENENEYCELQKMYILPKARGKGIGKKLMISCLEFAEERGYKKCYLETFSHMNKALKLYEKYNFRALSSPKGNTFHTACDVWMEVNL